MKKTLSMIDMLREIQVKNAAHSDKTISFSGKNALSVLRHVEEALKEEIVVCRDCLYLTSIDELVLYGHVDPKEAEKKEAEGCAGKCVKHRHEKYVQEDDYCSFGSRNT